MSHLPHRPHRPHGFRHVPLVSWALVALAVLYVALNASNDWITVFPTLAGAAPFVFAAAMLWAGPEDRRFTYGTWAIVASGVLRLLSELIVHQMEPTTTLLADAARWLSEGAWVLEFVGVVLIGVALGGLRSNRGQLVFWIGVLIALAGVAWVTTHQGESVGPFDVLIAAAGQSLPAAWGYLAGAGLDAGRRWFAIGGIVMLLYFGLSILVLWFPPAPDMNLDAIRFGIAVVGFCALVALILAAVKLAPDRSQGVHSQAG